MLELLEELGVIFNVVAVVPIAAAHAISAVFKNKEMLRKISMNKGLKDDISSGHLKKGFNYVIVCSLLHLNLEIILSHY